MFGSLRTGYVTMWLAVWLLLPAIGRAEADRPVKVLIANPTSRFLSAKKMTRLADSMRSLAGRYGSLKLVSESGAKSSCAGKGQACWLDLGKRLGADQVVLVHFQKLPFRFVVSVRAVEVGSGKTVSKFRRRIRGRPRNLDKLVHTAWFKMFGPTVDSFIRVTANTLGAQVKLNGVLIGKAPVSVTRPLGAGRHTVTVVHPGYQEQTQSLTVAPGTRQHALRFEMARSPVDQPVEQVAAVSVAQPEPMPPVSKPKPEPALEGKKLVEADPGPIPDRPSAVEVETIELRSPGDPGSPATDLPMETVASQPAEVYRQWWFWTSVAAALVAGLTTTVLLSSDGKDVIPIGKGRAIFEF